MIDKNDDPRYWEYKYRASQVELRHASAAATRAAPAVEAITKDRDEWVQRWHDLLYQHEATGYKDQVDHLRAENTRLLSACLSDEVL
jgi:hypothetical protein